MKLSDEAVASLEDFLAQDKQGELMNELLHALDLLQQRLARERRKLQRPQDYRALEAAEQAAQAAQLTMAMVRSSQTTH